MKYVPLVGVGLAVWGLITLDWFKAGVGAALFLGAFLFDLFKKKGVMKDDKVFASYRNLTELIRVMRSSLDHSKIDARSPKATLAQGLFFLGMIDAASQALRMTDKQFLQLFSAIFHDLDFDDDFKSRVLLFHQALDTDHKAFPAIMKGGGLYSKFINGNTVAPLAGGGLIQELIEDPNFPTSVGEL